MGAAFPCGIRLRGELELIRYTICTSAMAFEDSAAAAVSWELFISRQPSGPRSLCLPVSVSEGLLGKYKVTFDAGRAVRLPSGLRVLFSQPLFCLVHVT